MRYRFDNMWYFLRVNWKRDVVTVRTVLLIYDNPHLFSRRFMKWLCPGDEEYQRKVGYYP